MGVEGATVQGVLQAAGRGGRATVIDPLSQGIVGAPQRPFLRLHRAGFHDLLEVVQGALEVTGQIFAFLARLILQPTTAQHVAEEGGDLFPRHGRVGHRGEGFARLLVVFQGHRDDLACLLNLFLGAQLVADLDLRTSALDRSDQGVLADHTDRRGLDHHSAGAVVGVDHQNAGMDRIARQDLSRDALHVGLHEAGRTAPEEPRPANLDQALLQGRGQDLERFAVLDRGVLLADEAHGLHGVGADDAHLAVHDLGFFAVLDHQGSGLDAEADASRSRREGNGGGTFGLLAHVVEGALTVEVGDGLLHNVLKTFLLGGRCVRPDESIVSNFGL